MVVGVRYLICGALEGQIMSFLSTSLRGKTERQEDCASRNYLITLVACNNTCNIEGVIAPGRSPRGVHQECKLIGC